MGRVYTEVPDGCSLIKPATIGMYAAGATCATSPFDKPITPGLTLRMPSWRTDTSSGANIDVNVDVRLSVGSGVLDTQGTDKGGAAREIARVREKYKSEKDSAVSLFDGDLITLKASHPLTGIGDEAYFYYGISTISESADAGVVARSGNAEFSVTYSGSRLEADFSRTAVPRQEVEAAVTAVARDVLASLG